MSNLTSYFTNSNRQLLKKQIMADVNPDCWTIFNCEKNQWEKVQNPTINYFNQDGISCKRETSIGLVEISTEKAETLKQV
jgi:hypothetical protein